MSIVEAKKELYQRLKGHPGVTGAGIKQHSGNEIIVIFITRPKNQLDIKIPNTFKGKKVSTELRSIARAM